MAKLTLKKRLIIRLYFLWYYKEFKDGIRILGRGKITSKVNILVNGASKTAIEQVKKAGGNLVLIEKNKKDTE